MRRYSDIASALVYRKDGIVLSPLAAVAYSAQAGIAQLLKGAANSFVSLLPAPAAASSKTSEVDEERVRLHDDSLQNSLRKLEQQLRARFQAAGVSLNQSLILRPDGFGGVAADVDHPQFSTVERIFEQDRGLQAEFRDLVESIRQHPAVQGQGPFKETSVAVALEGGKLALISPTIRSAANSAL